MCRCIASAVDTASPRIFAAVGDEHRIALRKLVGALAHREKLAIAALAPLFDATARLERDKTARRLACLGAYEPLGAAVASLLLVRPDLLVSLALTANRDVTVTLAVVGRALAEGTRTSGHRDQREEGETDTDRMVHREDRGLEVGGPARERVAEGVPRMVIAYRNPEVHRPVVMPADGRRSDGNETASAGGGKSLLELRRLDSLALDDPLSDMLAQTIHISVEV